MEFLHTLLKYDISSVRFFCKKSAQPIMRYLNVAEKNDAAKNIAAILSRGASTRVSDGIKLIYRANVNFACSARVFQTTTKSTSSVRR